MPAYLAKPITPTWQPSHPLGNGLAFFLAAHGPADVGSARDCVGGLNLSGSARTGQGGVVCDATGKGFEATLPASLNLTLPITIACQVRFLGTPDANAGTFGLISNNTNAAPFFSAMLYSGTSGGTFLGLGTNSGGAFDFVLSSVTVASRVGFRDIVVGVLAASTRTLYLNGVSIAAASGSYLNPTYGATALVAAGNYTGANANPNCVIEGGAAWNRALSLAEIQGLTADFFAPVRPRSALAVLAATLPPPAAFQAAWAASSNQFIGGGY